MLYQTNDVQIATYRHYAEASLAGETPIYEELFHLQTDPEELHNVIQEKQHEQVLSSLRKAWKEKLTYARGSGKPKVLRYTNTSKLESVLKERGKSEK